VNGQPFVLRGRQVEQCSEAEALAMRRAGINLWLVRLQDHTAGVWELADRLGFFVLGQVVRVDEDALAVRLEQHSSCLGWLVPAIEPFRGLRGLLGIWADDPAAAVPSGTRFVACPADQAGRWVEVGMPVLTLGPLGAQGHQGETIFGSVEPMPAPRPL
jgi:hypothetical protein